MMQANEKLFRFNFKFSLLRTTVKRQRNKGKPQQNIKHITVKTTTKGKNQKKKILKEN